MCERQHRNETKILLESIFGKCFSHVCLIFSIVATFIPFSSKWKSYWITRIAFGSLFLNCMFVYMKSWLYYVETQVVRCVAGIRKFENPFRSERRIIKHHNNAFFFFSGACSMWLAEHNPDLSRLVVLFWYLRKGKNKNWIFSLRVYCESSAQFLFTKTTGRCREKVCVHEFEVRKLFFTAIKIFCLFLIAYRVDFKEIISGCFLPAIV